MTDMKAKYRKLARELELMESEMKDPTEAMRREMLETNQPHVDLAHADKRWTTQEMSQDFTVQSFLAPFVFVTRRADGVRGTLEFTHSPRFYFNFKPD